ncbi:peroxidase-like isoform X1 [Trichoplusia ni]|uniref:Peroxidase-like isoform X1 n=2 Tax=Trichoplusia ni TaxID=7111 RepID=A0A7E5VUD9_TRINI|nr:peroxidase-like isoform X1 [Trichoplusia ni]
MLFKRIIEGKSMLNTDTKKCSRRKSECDGCSEHFTILEEMAKMVLLGVVLWAGVTFGSHVAPYPLNLIISTDISHPPPMYDFPFPSAEMLRRLPAVTATHTNRSVQISKFEVSMLERLELNLKSAGITPKTGSAARGLVIDGYASDDAMHYEKSSMTITKASQNLVYTRCRRYGLANDECASFISTLNLRESEYGPECAALERFTCHTNKMSSKYRTFDGSCNNPVRSSWGQALTGYKRLLHPKYADGIEEPRRALSHKALPSARLVSTKLTSNQDLPNNDKTIALAVWSQFVYHDLVHTPVRKSIHTNQAIRCCDEGFPLTPRYIHPSCMPISVPHDDAFYKKKYVTCMEYTRSITTYRGDCTFGASEQMNQATHFLDGSNIYGSNSRDAAALREKSGGLLKTTNIDDEEHLPLAANPTEKCLVGSSTETCFNAGDARANTHPWMASMYAVWVREHNRVARGLANLNPGWNSDRLYHEARRIVVAELQHITYKSWLPTLTGRAFEELYESYDLGYNSDIDPTITNPFATAGFHFVNSLLDQDIQMIDDNNNVTSQRLHHNYFKPEIVAKNGGLKQILKGMVNQNSQQLDLNYDDDLRHQWLGELDVLAIDVQRGRDHGLPGYTQYRALCGLPAVSSFQQMTDVIPQETVNKLSEVYEQPGDIDLVVGLMAETPVQNSLLGPTAICLIKEQLWRTKTGDRYFYSHQEEAGKFTKRQLTELKRASLARIMCDNAPFTQIQRDVFEPVSESNPLVSCEEIKRVNLEAWQDPAQQPDILTRTNKWIKNKVGSNSTK